MVPSFTLNNGLTIPVIGLGVFQSSPEDTLTAVGAALESGYRLIDTAAAYLNERQVGEAIAQSGFDRSEIIIESKVWISDYGYDKTLHAFDKASRKLGVDQIDIYILHQPLNEEFELVLDAYRALETLLNDGKVRAIGVSNFLPDHLDRLLASATMVPTLNQVESHPYFRNSPVIEKNTELGILTQAWSPIGGITFYAEGPGGEQRSTLKDPVIAAIADAHGKTPAQVMLRWHIQEGRQVIPKSVTPSRIQENLDLFDFELSTEELAAIDALDTDSRGGPDPHTVTTTTWAFDIPED